METTKLHYLLLFLALSQVYSALSDDPDERLNKTSRLQVIIPHSLHKEDGYEHEEAMFGVPHYGGSIAQNVYYSDSIFCDQTNEDTHGGFPVRDIGEDGKMKPWPSPFILMVDRGKCTFVQKVRNAQKAGAAGVIIADTLCLCSDTECRKTLETSEDNPQCQLKLPLMADDGSGGDITIPSFLMLKEDAGRLKKEVKDNQMVQVEMKWSLPTPDDRVEYDLWTFPSDPGSRDVVQRFRPLTHALGEHAFFTPHMLIYDGKTFGCRYYEVCGNMCTNHGRYCATDPDGDVDVGLSGADVVRESLRRICIWKHHGGDGIGEEWWNYIEQFLNKCDSPELFTNQECINDVLKQANIDKQNIEQCMKDSGGTQDDHINSLLDKEIESWQKHGIVVVPTTLVNTVPIRGGLNADALFNAICAGYLEGTQPDICMTCAGCPDLITCTKQKVCDAGIYAGGSEKKGVSKKVFAMSLLSVCIVFGAAGYLHWKKTRDDMREQVRGILAEYMPLEGGDDDNNENRPDLPNQKIGIASFI
jgi:hypothetical protein